MPLNFAVVGVAGYVAPRHLRAIRETGNHLVAAVDPSDSVGILDQFSFDVKYFREIERFDRHIEKLHRLSEELRVHYISICSPSYLHDAHCRLALRAGANAICEKPLVVNPWNLDLLQELEDETGHCINTVLQLRLHPDILRLREVLSASAPGPQRDVILTYITSRGDWYHRSWKGQEEKSGGLATNIGIHFFDLLIWLFGEAGEVRVHHADERRVSGFVELERARIRWFLSVDHRDLPTEELRAGRTSYRSILVDDQEVDFSDHFQDLHTRVYQEALAGRGFRIPDVRPSIELTHRIRTTPVRPAESDSHPLLRPKI